MPDRDDQHDDLEPIRHLPIMREIGVELRALAAEEDARTAGRPRGSIARLVDMAGGPRAPRRGPGRWWDRRAVGGLAVAIAGTALAAGFVRGADDAGTPHSPPSPTSVAIGGGDPPAELQLRF